MTFIANPGAGGDAFASDIVAGEQVPYSKIGYGAAGTLTPVNDTNRFPIALSTAQLAALAPLTTQPVSGTFWQATQPVSAPSNLPTSNNATIFQFSTNNTSTAQLAAGATFTGVIETALDQPAISLLMTSDQPTTLTVKQYIDSGGTRAVPDIVFYIAAGAGFARSFTLNGNHVNVTAQNTGASATTTFNLNTAYGDLGDSDSSGVMPVTELPLVLTGAAAQTATVNNILGPTSGTAGLNVSGYRAASVQVVCTATGGTFIFEQSNNNVDWAALPVFNAALITGVAITSAITATNSAIIYTFPLRCNFVRLRIATTLTGGSAQAFSRIGTDPWTPSATLVAQPTLANLNMQAALVGGTNVVGDVGQQYRGNATGAASGTHIVSAATTNATIVKASAGRVLGWSLLNTTATIQYVKLHNQTTSPTAGTGVVRTIGIPANGARELAIEGGIAFTTGIGMTIVTGSADADATATTLGAVIGDLFFA